MAIHNTFVNICYVILFSCQLLRTSFNLYLKLKPHNTESVRVVVMRTEKKSSFAWILFILMRDTSSMMLTNTNGCATLPLDRWLYVFRIFGKKQARQIKKGIYENWFNP